MTKYLKFFKQFWLSHVIYRHVRKVNEYNITHKYHFYLSSSKSTWFLSYLFEDPLSFIFGFSEYEEKERKRKAFILIKRKKDLSSPKCFFFLLQKMYFCIYMCLTSIMKSPLLSLHWKSNGDTSKQMGFCLSRLNVIQVRHCFMYTNVPDLAIRKKPFSEGLHFLNC